jgi:hypothetical protein
MSDVLHYYQLTKKPHARVPLVDYSGVSHRAVAYPHPYASEIQSLDYEAWMLSSNVETPFNALDATPFHHVQSDETFDELLRHLESVEVKEIAIDLEANNIRSYHGFCCLMQVMRRIAQCPRPGFHSVPVYGVVNQGRICVALRAVYLFSLAAYVGALEIHRCSRQYMCGGIVRQ